MLRYEDPAETEEKESMFKRLKMLREKCIGELKKYKKRMEEKSN